MKTILEILELHNVHGFDKNGGTDKGTIHSYTGAYEELLSSYRDKDVNLLEVGIQYGGSSLLWHDYLPKSRLAMVDVWDQVNPVIFTRMDKSRYNFYVADAYSDETALKIQEEWPDGFDIAIDDGPHSLESQILFIKKYLPMMRPGGILIIEDIQDFGHMEILKENTPDEYKNKVEIIDLRRIKQRYDDLMFVIRK